MKRTLFCIICILAAAACTKINYTYEYVYEKPVLGNLTVSSIGSQSVILTGIVSKDGGKKIQERGFILSKTSFTTQVPATATRIKADGAAGLGKFSKELTGLTSGTTYYACSYGKNEKGEVRSAVVSFVTGKDPEVVLESVSLDKLCYSHGASSPYSIQCMPYVSLVCPDMIESAGVIINGYSYTFASLPENEKTPKIISQNIYSQDGEFTINVSAFAVTKSGQRLETEEKSFQASAMGVKMETTLAVEPCRWYTEKESKCYTHNFEVKLHMIEGTANMARIGYYPNTTNNIVWFGNPNQYTYTDNTSVYSSFSSETDSPTLTVLATGLVELKNGRVLFCSNSIGEDEATSNFNSPGNYEVFSAESFTTGTGKFSTIYSVIQESSYTWQWNKSGGYLYANSYADGQPHLAHTRAESDLIDLSARASAKLYFRLSANYFTDIANEFGIQVHSSQTGLWTDMDTSPITNYQYWKNITYSLDAFAGDRIKIAFVYKGTDQACGSISLDNIEVYTVNK